MKFKDWLEEEMTTATVGETDADAVTSNKLLRVNLSDSNIKSIVNKLKKKKGVKVTVEDGVATIDIPYEAPKSVMKQLSSYTV